MEKNKVLNLGLIVGLLIALVFVGGCVPPEGGAEGGSGLTLIIILVLMFAMFYLLFIRPQRKRQKEHQDLMQELKRGDRVITAGGIYGVIESVSEDSVVIKVESGVTMRVARGSVAGKREK